METHRLATAFGLWVEELSGDSGPSASSKPQLLTAKIPEKNSCGILWKWKTSQAYFPPSSGHSAGLAVLEMPGTGTPPHP